MSRIATCRAVLSLMAPHNAGDVPATDFARAEEKGENEVAVVARGREMDAANSPTSFPLPPPGAAIRGGKQKGTAALLLEQFHKRRGTTPVTCNAL